MGSYSTDLYGDAIADHYDELLAPMAGETAAAVAFLADLARGGRALELGVGTGRVAVPLAAAGVEVHGVDSSTRMLARLRDNARAAGVAVEASVGDFAELGVPGRFDLAFVVFNTLYALGDQEQQVACLRGVAASLRPGGAFVVEAFVPDLGRLGSRRGAAGGGQGGRPDSGQALLHVTRHDPVSQTIRARQPIATPQGMRMLPVRMRYVWPSELDLMARLAGLRLRDRFGGWDRRPFTAASFTHVSVYRAPHG